MLQEILNRTNEPEIKNWINTTLKKHIEKNKLGPSNQAHLEHLVDYLESRPRPLRLKRMSVKQAEELARKWTKTLEKKGSNVVELAGDVKTIKRFANGFKLVQLLDARAFKREGFLMRHCVGSYADKNGVKIYSLRDPMNNPHCTIEVVNDGSDIQQVKGKGNGPIHPDYIKMVISSLKKLGMKVRSSEMENLGYSVVDEELKKDIFRLYGKNYFKLITFNKESYISLEETRRKG